MSTAIRWVMVLSLGIPLLGQLLYSPQVSAVEFVIVGPRAVGMGGAGVAVTTDALATYWNPAGLAMTQDVDIRLQFAAQGIDRLGIRRTLDDINDLNRTDITLANQAQLQALLDRLNGASVSALAAAGLYFKGYVGNHAFGLNVSDVATGGFFTPTPLTAQVTGPLLTVDGQLQADALEARQVALSYAHRFLDDTLAIGVTGKIIQGAAYSNGVAVISADSKFNFSGDLGEANISHEVGVDVGMIVQPFSWVRLAVMGKDLNEPSFNAPGGAEFKLVPQIRAGIAINPYETLTIAFDGDVSSNKTLVPGLKSRVLSLGAEQTMLSEFLSLRMGVLKDVEDAQSIFTPTAGLGIRMFAFRFDAGGGYDFSEGQALLSVSLSLTF